MNTNSNNNYEDKTDRPLTSEMRRLLFSCYGRMAKHTKKKRAVVRVLEPHILVHTYP